MKENIQFYGTKLTNGEIHSKINSYNFKKIGDDVDFPSSILTLCENLSTFHSEKLGFNDDWYTSNNKGWVITKWHLEISDAIYSNSMSVLNDLSLNSWISPHGRIQLHRSFLGYDLKNTCLFKVYSNWLLLDTLKRRPSRLPSEVSTAFSSSNKISFEPLIKDHNINLKNISPTKSSLFIPDKNNIDINNHINNISYVQSGVESIKSIIPDLKFISMDISYLKESFFGDIIEKIIFLEPQDDTYIGQVCFYKKDSVKRESLCTIEFKGK